MTLNEAKEEILKRGIELLERDSEGKRYVCPVCKSGNDEEEKGLQTNDKILFTCPLGCFENKNILEIIGMNVGTNNEENMIRAAASELQISLDEDEEENEEEEEKENKKTLLKKDDEDGVDYTLFYKESVDKITKCNFLQSKGISKEVQNNFDIGYYENWIHPNTSEDMRQYIAATPRIIIPFTKDSYAALYTGDNVNVAAVQRVGEDTIFNIDTLYDGIEPIFVYENEIDALSTIECGYDAISIGGISHLSSFYNKLREKKSVRLLVFCIDDKTEEGQEIALDLSNKLAEINQDYIVYDIIKKYKSANEFLCTSKEEFLNSIKKGLDKAREHQLEKVKAYQAIHSNIKYIAGFEQKISKEVTTENIPTTIKELNNVLDGGFYEGLYSICSEYPIGKTTFALQIADNIAEGNSEVLYFTMQTARNELIAKSISRITADISIKSKGQISQGKNMREIIDREMHDKYTADDNMIFEEAISKYKKFANNIFMHECNDINALQIREIIEEHIRQTSKAGRKLAVVIDSLENLSENNDVTFNNSSDNGEIVKGKSVNSRNEINMNIKELKRISRDNKIPIIVLSSKNSLDIVKDCCFDTVLELKTVPYSDQLDKTIDLMKKEPRILELGVLKNRNGRVGDILQIIYFANYNLFLCRGLKENKISATTEKQGEKEEKKQEEREDVKAEDEQKDIGEKVETDEEQETEIEETAETEEEQEIEEETEEAAETEEEQETEEETEEAAETEEEQETAEDMIEFELVDIEPEEPEKIEEKEEKEEVVVEKIQPTRIIPPYANVSKKNGKHSSKKKRKHR